MTKQRTDDRLRVRYPVTPKSSKSKTSNAERCKAYRDKLKQDPLLIPKIRAKDIERAKRNRKRPKSKELIERERQLNKERQKRYRLDINCGRGKIHLCAVCLLQFCMFINVCKCFVNHEQFCPFSFAVGNFTKGQKCLVSE